MTPSATWWARNGLGSLASGRTGSSVNLGIPRRRAWQPAGPETPGLAQGRRLLPPLPRFARARIIGVRQLDGRRPSRWADLHRDRFGTGNWPSSLPDRPEGVLPNAFGFCRLDLGNARTSRRRRPRQGTCICFIRLCCMPRRKSASADPDHHQSGPLHSWSGCGSIGRMGITRRSN